MPLTRRRFLTIAAGTAALACIGPAAIAGRPEMVRWRGSALGAQVEILLPSPGAGAAIDVVLAEIDRLEDILSLYRPASALCRLNRDGALKAPPLELVEVLAHAQAVSLLTAGAFDVTVQPLWERLAQGGEVTSDVLALVDWRGVEVSPAAIGLARPGMKVTLNGIAQGYVSDRVAELLRRRGYENVLLDLGEPRALGRHPAGRAWKVSPGGDAAPLPLHDGALATSAPGPGRQDLFNPVTGATARQWRRITVQARSAMHADALSTAFAVMPEDAVRLAFANSGASAAWLQKARGTAVRL